MVTVAAAGGIQVPLRTAEEMFPVGLPAKHHFKYKQKFDKNSERRYTGFLNYLLHWIFLY